MFAELNKPCSVDRACECCHCHENPFADLTPNPIANFVLTGVVASKHELIMFARVRRHSPKSTGCLQAGFVTEQQSFRYVTFGLVWKQSCLSGKVLKLVNAQ